MPARIISGTPTAITAHRLNSVNASRPCCLDHRRAQRRAEQVRVQEVPDVGRAEDVVAQRPVLLDRQPQPAEAGLGPVERPQHVIQPEEHRHLRQHRQTAEDRVEPVLLWSFCISSAIRWRSLPYFFCSALICGCNSCICRVVRICLTNGLYRMARSVNTRNITDSAQAKKFDGPRTKANTLYQTHMIAETG